jgi:hypothetical protein
LLPLQPLKNVEGTEHARDILARVAAQVEPILAGRPHWRVLELREFYPKNDNLLGMNVNRGSKIYLRLRAPGSKPAPPTRLPLTGSARIADIRSSITWLPFDSILDTMLHELAHNSIGPHNEEFDKLWKDLRAECEKNISQNLGGSPLAYGGSKESINIGVGIVYGGAFGKLQGVQVIAPPGRELAGAYGIGAFQGEGKRLSDAPPGVSSGAPQTAAARRAAAAAAADKRAQRPGGESLNGGQRLGGRPPAEIVAAAAQASFWGRSLWTAARNGRAAGGSASAAPCAGCIDLTDDGVGNDALTLSSGGGARHARLGESSSSSSEPDTRRVVLAAAAEMRIRALEDAACPSGGWSDDPDPEVQLIAGGRHAQPPTSPTSAAAPGSKRRRGPDTSYDDVVEILSSPDEPRRRGAASGAPVPQRMPPHRVVEVIELNEDGDIVDKVIEVN